MATGTSSPSSPATSRRASRPQPRSATTGCRSRRAAMSCPTASRTAARPSASAGSVAASRAATSGSATPSGRPSSDGSERPVGPQEQVAERPAAQAVVAAAADMLPPVVPQVAALAQRLEVAEPGILRVVVEVRRAEPDSPRLRARVVDHVRPGRRLPRVVAPGPRGLVVPAAVAELDHQRAVRPATRLAAAARALEADAGADQPPVDRVEPAQLGPYRHQHSVLARARRRALPWRPF